MNAISLAPRSPLLQTAHESAAPLFKQPLWQELVPVISTIALGVFYSPVFCFGAAVGVIDCSVHTILSYTLFSNPEQSNKGTYLKELIDTSAFITCVVGPIIEEFLCRGLLLHALKHVATTIFTNRSILLPLGIAMPASTIAAIIISSVIFGMLHLSNDHEGATDQVILCTLGGLTYGVLAESFGITASIGAHIANNSLLISLLKIVHSISPLETSSKPKLSQHAPIRV
ncbi:MAG: CPBP family intramembrane metalloprotease [Simkania sp.]|nr:CPBP family intramembrane metalloprotease [Simkania sp.]